MISGSGSISMAPPRLPSCPSTRTRTLRSPDCHRLTLRMLHSTAVWLMRWVEEQLTPATHAASSSELRGPGSVGPKSTPTMVKESLRVPAEKANGGETRRTEGVEYDSRDSGVTADTRPPAVVTVRVWLLPVPGGMSKSMVLGVALKLVITTRFVPEELTEMAAIALNSAPVTRTREPVVGTVRLSELEA